MTSLSGSPRRRLGVVLLTMLLALALTSLTTTGADAAAHKRKRHAHHKVHHVKKAKVRKCLVKVKGKRRKVRRPCPRASRWPAVPPLVLNYDYARSASPIGGTWGTYTGSGEELSRAYAGASGDDKVQLGKTALQPKVRWFGAWIPPGQIGSILRDHIANTQHGDPDALVQLATFNLWPTSEADRNVPLTPGQRQTYIDWVNAAAAAIGNTRTLVVVEPDLGIALRSPDTAVREGLAAYAARTFSALPRTTVYLDATSADWLPPANTVQMLLDSGVAYARGFALGATHNDDTGSNMGYARVVAAGLAGRGVPDKHAIIDTVDNGHAFTYGQYFAKYPNGHYDPPVCHSAGESVCWGIDRKPSPISDGDVDAFTWIGRPWLKLQASPFDYNDALWLGRTAPY